MAEAMTFAGLRYPPDGSIIDGVELRISAGERLGLFGPNGAGKTTLLRLIAGTLPGTTRRTDVTYLPQQPHVFRGTVRSNLGLSRGPETVAVGHLDGLGVGHLIDRPASSLSGGEIQRVALARTLSDPAPLVALDEPLSMIDRVDRPAVITAIRTATEERALVCVTHSIDDAAALVDTLAIVDDGRIIQRGDIQDVATMPTSGRVAEIVGITNVLHGVVAERTGDVATIDIGEHRMVAMTGAPLGSGIVARFDAASVAVFTEPPHGASHRNVIQGTVAAVVRRGRFVEVVLDGSPPIAALVTEGARDALGLHEGSSVWFGVKAAAVEVIRS